MPALNDGNYLNQYVAPQLLVEFKNLNDNFIQTLGGVPAEAVNTDGIRFNKLVNNVDFLVNNTADFTAAAMNGQKLIVPWETYDTTPTSVTDAEIHGLAYDKRSSVRLKHSDKFKMGARDHAMWKLAPDDATNSDMPVMRTDGANDGNGRKRLTFDNVVEFLEKVKNLNLPDMANNYMVLCPQHATDLIMDTKSAAYFANLNAFFDPATGKLRSMMGFNFLENNAVLAYDSTGAKKAKGATMATTDRYASLFYYSPNTLYYINSLKVLYSPETMDTKSASPTSTFRLQAMGLISRIQDYGVGAIVSGIVA